MDEDETEHPDDTSEQPLGEYPEGVGPEVFRDRLAQLVAQDPAHGAHLELDIGMVPVEDIESVEAEDGGHRSRINLRNGIIVGGLTGAAIVAALATIRYRQRRGR